MSPKKIIQSKPTTIPVRVTSPASPPGPGSIEHFTATCTSCRLCVSACPSRVLVPSFLEFGFLGMMQPRMNFQRATATLSARSAWTFAPAAPFYR